MGISQTKEKRSSPSEKVVQELKNKVHSLEHELNEIMRTRDSERQTYERTFAFKQAEWKAERKRLKANAKALDEEERERRRDETVEKWKQLYFAVKLELDHLIQRTHQEADKGGEALVELRNEVRSKEDLVGVLRSKVASLEQRESKREREMDILRQSLRIMSHSKRGMNTIKLGRRSCR